MFCGHCGSNIANGEKFCGSCGAPVTGVEEKKIVNKGATTVAREQTNGVTNSSAKPMLGLFACISTVLAVLLIFVETYFNESVYGYVKEVITEFDTIKRLFKIDDLVFYLVVYLIIVVVIALNALTAICNSIGAICKLAVGGDVNISGAKKDIMGSYGAMSMIFIMYIIISVFLKKKLKTLGSLAVGDGLGISTIGWVIFVAAIVCDLIVSNIAVKKEK